jgi:hypothetical protein
MPPNPQQLLPATKLSSSDRRRHLRHLFKLGQFLVNFGLLELVAHPTPHAVEDGLVALDERALETLVPRHWPLEATWNMNVSCVAQ